MRSSHGSKKMSNLEATPTHTSMTASDQSSRGCAHIPLPPPLRCSRELPRSAFPKVSHASSTPCFWKWVVASHPPWPWTSALQPLACVTAMQLHPTRGVAGQVEKSPSVCGSDPWGAPSSTMRGNTEESNTTPKKRRQLQVSMSL